MATLKIEQTKAKTLMELQVKSDNIGYLAIISSNGCNETVCPSMIPGFPKLSPYPLFDSVEDAKKQSLLHWKAQQEGGATLKIIEIEY